ncbi:DUF6585 family protein [Ktedonobacter robiniae]|uniref:Uncharacterized protein n=1 Tax=Ktedonobacter robiniae TaxID=2778365 RepID=A0ABQ3V3Y3_9CHLR|nr:DUF6585 family protein [Ktedonobacter robiniae]GHO59628.1 hypothetical protein KSB_81030 [Ktedonobacter robiniae]
MINQLQPESTIPSQIYELAVKHNVGTPLKRSNNKFAQVFTIVVAIFFLIQLGMLGYHIYGFIAFIFLSQTYPNVNSVPDNQLENYAWLKSLHDDFRQSSLQLISPLLAILNIYLPFASASRTRLYICTDGLLKVYKKQDEAIRWDEIQELYTPIGGAFRLIKEDGSNFSLPLLLTIGRNKNLMNIITEEMSHRLLPEMLARYERNETLTFGDLRLNQKGIYGAGTTVYWHQIGDITSEQTRLSLYYSPLSKSDGSLTPAQWYTWKEPAATSRPNLPLFVALVNAILDQRSTSLQESASRPQQRQELKERAEVVWRKNKKRKRLTIASVIISSIMIFALIIGLLMTQKNMQYVDGEWFTFVPDKLSTQDAFTNYNYFPHNYHVQVNATFISGNKDTCISLAVHVQNFSGYQSFDICKDGAWLYYHWDGQSKTSLQMDSGKLPTVKKSYLLGIDVTDNIIALSVDNKPVISEHDSMYETTNQLEIVVYGDNNAKEVSAALFSDFSYQPEQ